MDVGYFAMSSSLTRSSLTAMELASTPLEHSFTHSSHGHLSSLLCGAPGSPVEHGSNRLDDDGSGGKMSKSFSEFSLLQFSSEIGPSHRNGLPAPTTSLVVEGPSPEAVVNSVRGSWGLGYLSIIALLFVSCANFIMSAVDEHWVEKSGRTSAARSASVTPTRFGARFGKRRSADTNSRSQLNAKLGPAAIHSLTEILGPILPFVGGGDLRRQDAEISLWEVILPESVADSWESPWYTMDNPVAATFRRFMGDEKTSLHSTDGKKDNNASWWPTQLNRGGAQEARGGGAALSQSRHKRPSKISNRETVLSATESFIHPSKIAQLTLTDITDLFKYAIGANRPGFDESSFVNGLRPEMTSIIKAVMEAVEKSRGKNFAPATTKAAPRNGKGKSKLSVGEYGDVDALQFAAAMRIFAEWRVVRQVPEGYKGYAVGMGLGHKDVVQNLVKVETAVFAWMEERRLASEEKRSDEDNKGLHSPTLRDILVEEVDLNLHAKLPRLKEKSAAMGLLWVRRQLHYQTQIFSNLYSGKYTDTNIAVAAAYKEVYGQFHGWAVQKIFNYSFQAAPPAGEVLKFMNPAYLEQVLLKAKTVKLNTEEGDENNDEKESDCEPIDGSATSGGDGGEDKEQNTSNPWERFGNHIGREWDKLGSHIASEWEKLVTNVARTFGAEVENEVEPNCESADGPGKMRRNSKAKRISLEGEALEKYVVEEMTRSAYKEFGLHLEMAEPLLEDLAGLFKELNMDDPTKV